jgi:hypothetical protein
LAFLESAVPRLRFVCFLVLTLSFGNSAFPQEPALLSPADESVVPPNAEAEIARLLQLARPQQKERARKLIDEYPGTRLAEILQRVLDEYAVFDQAAAAEQQAFDARTAGYKAYWQARCCPPPPFHPPVGEIFNGTGEPVLYEVRYDGIHRTRWMGPYRLRAGGSFASPHPYFIRYIAGGAMQQQVVVPGTAYTFGGVPGSSSFGLGPGVLATPTPPAPTLPMSEPAEPATAP